jgi:nitrite reductase (NADH) large subunit
MRAPMARQRLVVVGNGMAGLRLLEELVRRASDRFDITVVGAELHPAYNRVLLSPLLAGEIGPADVALRPAGWYAENGITLLTGDPAVAIAREERQVRLASGRVLPFDALVLATGSKPIRLTMPGDDLEGVTTFRTLQDAEALQTAAAAEAPVVVIGGGLLGIEAAYGLARAGARVTLVHLMDRLMERQLDAEGARLLYAALEAKGMRVLLGAETQTIEGPGKVQSVLLKDGRRLRCELVVMAVGVVPETALAAAAGLTVKRGIIVDDQLETSAPGIYALGECTEHDGRCYGLVEPAYEQARVLADVLGGAEQRYGGSVLATNLKVSGVPLFSAGDFEGAGEAECLVLRDGGSAYRKLVVRDGRLAGTVLVGDTSDALWYLDLIRSGAPIAAMREHLAFGRAYAEAA